MHAGRQSRVHTRVHTLPLHPSLPNCSASPLHYAPIQRQHSPLLSSPPSSVLAAAAVRRLKKGEGRERHITQEEVIFTNDPPVPTDRPTDRPRDRQPPPPTAAGRKRRREEEGRVRMKWRRRCRLLWRAEATTTATFLLLLLLLLLLFLRFSSLRVELNS